MGDWQHVGKHRYRVEDDNLVVHWGGPTSGPEMAQLAAIEGSLQRKYGYALNLNFVHPGDDVGTDARRVFATAMQEHRIRLQVAVVGADLLTRTIATLVVRGGRVFSGLPLELAFFRTETEARDWLDKRRLLLAAPHP